MPHSLLTSSDTLLLVIDIQQRLFDAVHPKVQKVINTYAPALIQGTRLLEVPVVVTEQYPKGLGPTVPAVARVIEGITPFEKLSFSVMQDEQIKAAIEASGRRQIIVCGIETHVCVYQSVMDLLKDGYDVHVPRECVASRAKNNWEVGLGLMEQAGASITSIETVLFSLLGHAKHPAFKSVQALIK